MIFNVIIVCSSPYQGPTVDTGANVSAGTRSIQNSQDAMQDRPEVVAPAASGGHHAHFDWAAKAARTRDT
jgi:hypothetical protein